MSGSGRTREQLVARHKSDMSGIRVNGKSIKEVLAELDRKKKPEKKNK